MRLLSPWNVVNANGNLNFNFHFIAINFNLNLDSHVWLRATKSHSADLEAGNSGNKPKLWVEGERRNVQRTACLKPLPHC